MTYYTKIHFLEDSDFFDTEEYDCQNILGSSYNYALALIGKEEEFFDVEKSKFSKCGYDFEPNEKFYNFFEDLGSKDLSGGGDYYEIVKVNFIGITKDEINEFQEFFFEIGKEKLNFYGNLKTIDF